jgi:hypothetical protein
MNKMRNHTARIMVLFVIFVIAAGSSSYINQCRFMFKDRAMLSKTDLGIIHNTLIQENRKRRCPACNSANVVPIVYGLPTMFGVENEAKGNIHLGGCCVDADSPQWYCAQCSSAWRR